MIAHLSVKVKSLFSSTPRLRSRLAQLQTTLSLHMNKPTFQLKPLGPALRLKTTQKKQVSTIQRNIHKQFYNSLTDTPTDQAILLSQSTSHTGAHLMQPNRERTWLLIMPKRPYDWRVDTHGCFKHDNTAIGFGPRDQTAHIPVFLHPRTTNLPAPNSIMRSE